MPRCRRLFIGAQAHKRTANSEKLYLIQEILFSF